MGRIQHVITAKKKSHQFHKIQLSNLQIELINKGDILSPKRFV